MHLQYTPKDHLLSNVAGGDDGVPFLVYNSEPRKKWIFLARAIRSLPNSL